MVRLPLERSAPPSDKENCRPINSSRSIRCFTSPSFDSWQWTWPVESENLLSLPISVRFIQCVTMRIISVAGLFWLLATTGVHFDGNLFIKKFHIFPLQSEMFILEMFPLWLERWLEQSCRQSAARSLHSTTRLFTRLVWPLIDFGENWMLTLGAGAERNKFSSSRSFPTETAPHFGEASHSTFYKKMKRVNRIEMSFACIPSDNCWNV